MDTQDLTRLAGEAFHAAQGRENTWDASYEQELVKRGLCILDTRSTQLILLTRDYAAAIPAPYRNPHGDWCNCAGRAIGSIESRDENEF